MKLITLYLPEPDLKELDHLCKERRLYANRAEAIRTAVKDLLALHRRRHQNPAKVVFRLKREWDLGGRTIDLYEEIKSGRKKIEYRDASKYWLRRLCFKAALFVYADKLQDLTPYLKVHRAWFIVGFAKGNVPRLEAEITELFLDPMAAQLQIHIKNVKEILA